jgi:putative peptide zinc metalloprotease protein
MSKRPTFHESWYRVAALHPRLRPDIRMVRQTWRGEPWHVLRDPLNNQHFRLNEPAYYFVGLLDGRRAVQSAWEWCSQKFGDAAPTQGEVISLLGQLFSLNLINAEFSPDAQVMFERYRKRKRREMGQYVSNILFVRLPLFDPNDLLERWVGVLQWAFTWMAFVGWLGLLIVAGDQIAGRFPELFGSARNVLNPTNLVWLYLSFTLVKAVHELGHAFACKTFGRRDGTGGDVHTIGVMMMVLMPMPYVDATSAWSFRNKYHRVIVSAAGMYLELAVAAVAAIVWAHTTDGLTHTLAYNTIFVAGVSTVLFNANPLMRFDGYYIFSDLLELPNLAQRSQDMVKHVFRRYVFGVRSAVTTVAGLGEAVWLGLYGIGSLVYRVIISVGILLFVADSLFFIGLILAAVSVVGWLGQPLYKFVRYLLTDSELSRCRGRAVGVTAVGAVLVGVLVGVVPMPEHGRAEGVLEPVRITWLHMPEAGFIENVAPPGSAVPTGAALVVADNPDLTLRYGQLLAREQELAVRYRLASSDETAKRQAAAEQLQVVREQCEETASRLARLRMAAPFAGAWYWNDNVDLRGTYLERGQRVGVLIDDSAWVVRAVADQYLGPRLRRDEGLNESVDMRLKNRPGTRLSGTIERVHPSGEQRLPSPALGLHAGGPVLTDPASASGDEAIEPFFEIRIRPAADDLERYALRSGQRLVVRFELASKPLAVQWWRQLRQMFQKRFAI